MKTAITNPLTINNVDIPLLKESLKSFVATQTEFRDFDFEGSNISSLLDILAYNTYYNIFYTNILLTESFLDSAVQRDSLISILKPTGFIPKSFTSAKILVSVSIVSTVDDTTPQIVIPKYTSFTSGSNNFVNLDSLILTKDNTNNYTSEESLLLYEGEKILFRFIVSDTTAYFKLPYSNIDITTLQVRVFPDLHSYETVSSVDNPLIVYEQAGKLYTVDNNSKVYFIQEDTDGFYSIYFGDGVIGKSLEKTNIIETIFVNTSGTSGNDLSIITFNKTDIGNQSLSGYTSSSILINPVVSDLKSFDGAEKQNIESIRKFGAYHFEAQDRIFTIQDYEYYIKNYFNNIELLRVWGGEDNDPPRYGTVFIMLKLLNSETVSNYQKNILIKYLKTKSVLGLNLFIQDPNVVYVLPTLEVKIDPFNVKDSGLFVNKIMSYLQQYTSENFSGESFRPSDIIYFLKSRESLIKSVNCSTKLRKNVYAKVGSLETNTISFSTSIVPNTLVSSTNFSLDPTLVYINEKLFDDGLGNVIYQRTNKNTKVSDELKIGTVNYELGEVILENFLLNRYLENTYLTLDCLPRDVDLYTDNLSLFSLNYSTIIVTLIFDNKR